MDEWTVVERKKTSHKPAKPKMLPTYSKLVFLNDPERKLTTHEKQLCDRKGIACVCCFSDKASLIIKRPFAGCGDCYCCGLADGEDRGVCCTFYSYYPDEPVGTTNI